MIPNDHKSETIFSNAESGSEFAIHQNAAMFSMLSNGLYSDKVGAIVRELACNAYDSHIEAGCEDRPIEITVPTTMTHEFAVEDFGIGMDEETVRTVFAGYFNSSKQNNNDVTGAFGLGSKTPFIFNDTFTVRARKDGVERVFTAYMKDGVPHLAKTSENANAGVSDGVKVSVPVSPEYAARFTASIQEKLRWFKVPPKIINRNDIEIIPDDAVNLKVGEIKREHNGRGYLRILMGNVVYGVEFDSIGLSNPRPPYMDRCWIMRVPMGSVTVTPSRESLGLDDATIETVRTMFLSAYDEHVNSTWSEVLSSSFDKSTRRLNVISLRGNVSKIFKTYEHPKSKYGYHVLTGPLDFVREIYNSNTIGKDKRRGKLWLDVLNTLFGDRINTSEMKANIKCFHLTTEGISVSSTYGNPVRTCHPRIPKTIETLSHDYGVIEYFRNIVPHKMRKLHIVSHETMQTKPTKHVKAINAFIHSKDISLDVMARDCVLYIPTVIGEAARRRLGILLARVGIGSERIVYHGLDALRTQMLPEMEAQRKEKTSRKLTDGERKERKEKMIISCHSPEDLMHHGRSELHTYDLENDDVMYLTITKDEAEQIVRWSDAKTRFFTLYKLSEIIAVINNDKPVTLVIKHGNNSSKIEKVGIETLNNYLVRTIGDQLSSNEGVKKLDEVASMIMGTYVHRHHINSSDRMLYVNAITEVYPTGAIGAIVNHISEIESSFNENCDKYDVSLSGIDIVDFKAFVHKHFPHNVHWVDVAHVKVETAINKLERAVDYFEDDLKLPEPRRGSWSPSKDPSQLTMLVDVVKNSAKFIDDMFIENTKR